MTDLKIHNLFGVHINLIFKLIKRGSTQIELLVTQKINNLECVLKLA